MTTACQVVEIARRELGTVERPINRTKYGEWWPPDGEPWCAKWVAWVFDQAGLNLRVELGADIAWTPTFAKRGKDKGWAVSDGAKAGDILLFRFGLRINHVGIAIADAANGQVVTIEGNTSGSTSGSQTNGGMVAQRVRPMSKIPVVLRPPYDPCTAPAMEPQPANSIELANIAAAIRAAKLTVCRFGSRGPGVKLVQSRVGVAQDGEFGSRTAQAVRQWQAAHGLVVDGVVGPATWESLFPGV